MSTTTTPDPWPLPELQRARRAIVVVDVVESVRLMQEDESGFIDRWRRFVNQVRTEVLPAHGGRLVKSLGDGMLLEFASVPQAVAASFALHACAAHVNQGHPPASAIHLRIGSHVAEVASDEFDLYGAGVNLASRVAALASPDGTVVTADVRDALIPDLDAELDDLGECHFKHVAQPQRCFRLSQATQPAAAAMPAPVPLQAPSVAVLPLVDASVDGPLVLGQAIAEELIALLARSDRLSVISRLSTSALAARNLSATEVGARLGANYVLSGSIKGDRSRVALTFELADAHSGHVLWAETFAVRLADLLQPDCEVLAAAAAATADTIASIELARATSLPLPNLDSYTLMVGGVALMHRTGASDFGRARELLEHLAERSGRHPVPYAWLGKWHVLKVQQGWSADPKADARSAIDLTARALDADANCSLAHTVEGFARANILREFDIAGTCYERALTANPSDSLAWLLNGMLQAFQGDGDHAVIACDRALLLSPLDPLRYFYDALAASAALTAQKYDRAAELARRSLRLNRSHLSTHRALTAALELAGRHEEAALAAQELLARDPGFTVSSFLARTPGRDFSIGQRIAEALREAGVPVGHA
jgi:adenylate cyclase